MTNHKDKRKTISSARRLLCRERNQLHAGTNRRKRRNLEPGEEQKVLRTGYYLKNYRKTCFRIPDMLSQSNIQIGAHLKTHPSQDPYIKNKTNRKKEICV